MALVVVAFGLNGIGCKRSFLRGSDERYPLFTIKFIFFRAVVLGRQAAQLHMNAMWREAGESVKREVAYLRERSERADERASKAEAENYALRKVIKICSE